MTQTNEDLLDDDLLEQDALQKEELRRRWVKGPDGVDFEVEPLRDYYCDAPPTVMPGSFSPMKKN